MRKIVPDDMAYNDDDYFCAEGGDGVLRCSCGRQLVPLDDQTMMCPGGYPVYRVDQGEIFIDKWGNLMLKRRDHNIGGIKEATKEAAP